MIKIAILGFGTVGSGVAEVLDTNESLLRRRVNATLAVKYILDVRQFPDSRWADRFVTDFSVIENDPEISIVVETIGGATAALEYTRRALIAGKSVVTSNKEIVAEYGQELLELARAHGVCYLFEASVGGGIPIIHPLYQCLGGNDLLEITGILNGTTNYILTRMIRAGLTFEAALKEAQDLGYAERDPSADVEGQDACRKICILASIAFGRHIYPNQVPTKGITAVTAEDVALAASMGCRVKLLGRAIRQSDGRVCAFVEPHFLPEENPLAGVDDVFNAITVEGNTIGQVMFYGRGAGKLPTASAVVSDVMDVARGVDIPRPLHWTEGGADVVAPAEDLSGDWCVRFTGEAPEGAQLLPWEGPEGQKALLLADCSPRELAGELEGCQVLTAYRILA